MTKELHEAIILASKDYSTREIAKSIGMPKSTVHDWTFREENESYRKGRNDAEYLNKLLSLIADGTVYQGKQGLTLSGDMNAQDVFKRYGLDEEKWEISSVRGRPHGDKAYVSVSLRPLGEGEDQLEANFEDLIERLTGQGPSIECDVKEYPFDDPHLAVLSLADLHLGKLSVNETYTVEDARRDVYRATNDLLTRIKGHRIKTLALIVGNDLINVDGVTGYTTSGRVKPECNASWYRQFDVASSILINVVSRCLQSAEEVVVIHCPGNHDWSSSYGIASVVEAYFSNSDNVRVLKTRNGRNYFQFEQIGIAVGHGHVIKNVKDAAVLFALEAPQIWASSKTRDVYTGHLHSKQAINATSFHDEQSGVTVRRMSSLSNSDHWHEGQGYKGNVRGAEIVLYDKNNLVSQYFHNSDG